MRSSLKVGALPIGSAPTSQKYWAPSTSKKEPWSPLDRLRQWNITPLSTTCFSNHPRLVSASLGRGLSDKPPRGMHSAARLRSHRPPSGWSSPALQGEGDQRGVRGLDHVTLRPHRSPAPRGRDLDGNANPTPAGLRSMRGDLNQQLESAGCVVTASLKEPQGQANPGAQRAYG